MGSEPTEEHAAAEVRAILQRATIMQLGRAGHGRPLKRAGRPMPPQPPARPHMHVGPPTHKTINRLRLQRTFQQEARLRAESQVLSRQPGCCAAAQARRPIDTSAACMGLELKGDCQRSSRCTHP